MPDPLKKVKKAVTGAAKNVQKAVTPSRAPAKPAPIANMRKSGRLPVHPIERKLRKR